MGYKLVLLACLAAISWGQDVTEPPLDDLETTPSTNTSTTTSVPILRQINKVNDDGSYTYGFEAADGTFKIETRDDEGNVKGKYGFIDEFGELKVVEYSAGNGTGFEADSDILPQSVTPLPVPAIPQELPRIPALPPRARFPQRTPTQFGAPQFPQQQFASSQPEPQFSPRPQPFGRSNPQHSPRPQPQPQLISQPETETPPPRFNNPRARPQPQLPRPASPVRPQPPVLSSRPQTSVHQPFPHQSQFPGQQFPPQPQFTSQQFPQQPQFHPQQFPQQPQFAPQQFPQQSPFFNHQFSQQQPLPQRPQRPVNIALDGFSEDRNQDGFVDGSPEEAAKGNPINPVVPHGTSLLPAGTSPLPKPPVQSHPVQPQPQQPFLPQQPQSPFAPQQPQSPFAQQPPQNPFFSNQIPQGFNRFATPQPQLFPSQTQLPQLTPQQIQQIRQQQLLLAAQQGQFPQGQIPHGQIPQGQFLQGQFPQQQFPQQQLIPQQFPQQQFGQQPFLPQHFSDPRFAAQQFDGQQFPALFGGQPSVPQQFTPRVPSRQPVRGFRSRPASPPRTLPASSTPVQTKKPATSTVEP
ncbi:uncharacterized protein [Macrobrachium rosenbergii]|uniref:uncharacterized protein n=1 Tax=Macrobrachium rosenbergii TaxID=79674 RepID=UPI0034D4E2E9